MAVTEAPAAGPLTVIPESDAELYSFSWLQQGTILHSPGDQKVLTAC